MQLHKSQVTNALNIVDDVGAHVAWTVQELSTVETVTCYGVFFFFVHMFSRAQAHKCKSHISSQQHKAPTAAATCVSGLAIQSWKWVYSRKNFLEGSQFLVTGSILIFEAKCGQSSAYIDCEYMHSSGQSNCQ